MFSIFKGEKKYSPLSVESKRVRYSDLVNKVVIYYDFTYSGLVFTTVSFVSVFILCIISNVSFIIDRVRERRSEICKWLQIGFQLNVDEIEIMPSSINLMFDLFP